MSASDATVRLVANVIRRHVSDETISKIIADLLEVPGNKSFRDTVELLAIQLRQDTRVPRRAS